MDLSQSFINRGEFNVYHEVTVAKLVIFFHPLFSDGGVERTNIYLGKGLIEGGYDVEFLTTLATDHFQCEVSNAGIRMVELGGTRTLFTIGKILKHLVDASRRYDCVYFVGCQYYTNVVSMLVAIILWNRRQNIRFINSERNHFQEFSVNGGWKNKLIFFLVRRLYRFADLIVANSKETARDLSEVVGREVHWVYNPTINKRIATLSGELIDEDWFLSDQRPCVIGIGRLSLQKDFSTLIKAFRLVRITNDMKLVILGDGECRTDLEREVREMDLESDVYLPGFVANPYKFLAVSDVFVLSSLYEGLPNALIEAVYIGIPCVSTSCKSGPKEILLEGDGGTLVPVANEQMMADSIIDVLSNTKKAREKVIVASQGITRFHYDTVRKEFERVINL